MLEDIFLRSGQSQVRYLLLFPNLYAKLDQAPYLTQTHEIDNVILHFEIIVF